MVEAAEEGEPMAEAVVEEAMAEEAVATATPAALEQQRTTKECVLPLAIMSLTMAREEQQTKQEQPCRRLCNTQVQSMARTSAMSYRTGKLLWSSQSLLIPKTYWTSTKKQ